MFISHSAATPAATTLCHRLRARFESCGRLHVLGFLVHPGKLHHGSAEIGRRQCLKHFTLAIEESDAGRAIHFVGAPCGEVDVQSVEIHFEVRHGLACVEHEHGTHLVGAADNRRDVGNRSCGIAHMRDGNDLRAVGDYFVRGVGTHTAFLVQVEPFERGAGAQRKFLERQQHGMVFRLGDDDLIARFQRETLGGLSPASKRRVAECGGQQVQSCGGAGGDDDLLFAFRRIGANQLGHFGARILERHGATRGKLMRASVHSGVDGAVEVRFRVDHALRLLRCRGGIEVYQRMAVDFLVENRKLAADRCEIGHANALSESEPSGRYAS